MCYTIYILFGYNFIEIEFKRRSSDRIMYIKSLVLIVTKIIVNYQTRDYKVSTSS